MSTNQDQNGGFLLGRRSTTFQTHPLYKERFDDWILMDDTYVGERRIKERGLAYLPATAGQRQDGMNSVNDVGMQDYLAYRNRAVYHDVVREAVQSMVGVMHRKDAVITVPDKLKPMVDRATPDGESLLALLRKINEQQLKSARCGLLVEVPTGLTVDKAVPFIAMYDARSLINWDTGVSDEGMRSIEMVALDESAWERKDIFKWDFEIKTRVLMSDISQLQGGIEPAKKGYIVALLRDGKLEPEVADFTTPSIGGQTMDEVPFVFVNANDINPDPEAPPLLGLANIAIALYRADADYRHNLYMQGQDSLVIIGDSGADGMSTKRTGAGAIIDVPKGGDAKYIGVGSSGLSEQRTAIEGLLSQANERGTKLLEFDAGSKGASGEALKVRIAARTTTLTSIARTGAEGLAAALKLAAKWVGANPDEVSVEPNLEFADTALTGQDMMFFTQAKTMGLPISWESIHTLMAQNDLTQLTYDEETAKIDEEPPMLGAAAAPIMDPKTGQPMMHPTTGKPLTEPAPKRGVAGTSVAGNFPKPDDKSGIKGSKAGSGAGGNKGA